MAFDLKTIILIGAQKNDTTFQCSPFNNSHYNNI